jgi:hypothetical protein
VPAGASAAPAAPGDLAPPEPAPVRTDPPFGVPRLEPGNYRERTQQARERVRIIE